MATSMAVSLKLGVHLHDLACQIVNHLLNCYFLLVVFDFARFDEVEVLTPGVHGLLPHLLNQLSVIDPICPRKTLVQCISLEVTFWAHYVIGSLKLI